MKRKPSLMNIDLCLYCGLLQFKNLLQLLLLELMALLLYSGKLKLIGVSFRAILISCLASPAIFF